MTVSNEMAVSYSKILGIQLEKQENKEKLPIG
jgi:hypothetical protein